MLQLRNEDLVEDADLLEHMELRMIPDCLPQDGNAL